MEPKFAEFITDRKYLKNVSDKTQSWYRQTFKHLQNPDPTDADLKAFVIRLREQGLNAVSVNTFARCVNAYMHWLHVG
jgi:site-specific recombinase XerC